MVSISERLRKMAMPDHRGIVPYGQREMRDAADEIERLRRVLLEIGERGHVITNGDCGVLRDHARVALGLEPLDTR